MTQCVGSTRWPRVFHRYTQAELGGHFADSVRLLSADSAQNVSAWRRVCDKTPVNIHRKANCRAGRTLSGKCPRLSWADTCERVSAFKGVFSENIEQILADTCPRTLRIAAWGTTGQKHPPIGGFVRVRPSPVRREVRGICPKRICHEEWT